MSKITIETTKHSLGIQAEVNSDVKGNIMEFIAVLTALDSLRAKLVEDMKNTLSKKKEEGIEISNDYMDKIDKLIKGDG